MNKIILLDEEYFVELPDGKVIGCDRWYEKKTDRWHVRLPKDNPTGRQYIREDKVTEAIEAHGFYEFEDKTTGPRVLGGSNWQSYLTDEEKSQLEEAELVIASIKQACLMRKAQPKTEEEKLRHQIALYEARLAKLEANK